MKKTVLITGVQGGVGRATASLFAAEGWRVIGADRAEGDPPPHVDRHMRADVGDPGACERMFAELADVQLHALVNNAAIATYKPLLETTPAEWDAVLASNLRAAFLTTRAAHPLLKGNAAAIVNVSSVHAVATSRDIAAYAASKGGLVAFTRAAAIELAPDDIRVNVVVPGAVDTPMLRDGLARAGEHTPEQALEALNAHHLRGRVADPAEIAQTILFLADPVRSSFITGATLTADGGATARLSTE